MKCWMVVLAMAGATSAAAERNIGVAAGESWNHAETGLVLLPQLGGMARTSLTDATHTGRDVTARFEAPDHSLAATIDVFRPAIADVGLWLDAAQAGLESGQTFRNATRATAEPLSFSAGAQRSALALRQVYSAVGVPNRSMGLAYVPVGEWIVSIELSTTVLTASQLEARLQEVVGSVGWPGLTGAAIPVARAVMACKAPLAFPVRPAEPIIHGARDSVAAKPAREATGRTVWCREGVARRDYGVYRPDNDVATYVLLVNETGGVVRVGASAQVPGTQGANYTVTLQDVDGNVSTLPSFTSLPTPGQVWNLLGAASAPAP